MHSSSHDIDLAKHSWRLIVGVMVLLLSLSSLVSLTWAQGHDVDFLLGAADRVSDDVHHGSAQCAQCHPDITEQWAESSHRMSSFNNPYYAAAARVFIEDGVSLNSFSVLDVMIQHCS